jgi:hypothetical protein
MIHNLFVSNLQFILKKKITQEKNRTGKITSKFNGVAWKGDDSVKSAVKVLEVYIFWNYGKRASTRNSWQNWIIWIEGF